MLGFYQVEGQRDVLIMSYHVVHTITADLDNGEEEQCIASDLRCVQTCCLLLLRLFHHSFRSLFYI